MTNDRQSPTARRDVILVLFVFLFVLVGLIVLFASGVLRFGLSGPYAYVIYLIAGLLVALVCFGLLSSRGTANGKQLGYNIRIGGALVGFAVATGGGLLFEKYGHPPAETFPLRVLFIDSTGATAHPTGDLTVIFGSLRLNEPIDSTGSLLYQAIPVEFEGKSARIVLQSRNFELADQTRQLTLHANDSVEVKVSAIELPKDVVPHPEETPAHASYKPAWQCIQPGYRPQNIDFDKTPPDTRLLDIGLLDKVFAREPGCVTVLLDTGANVNGYRFPKNNDFSDGPALHLALNQSNWSIAMLLLQRGANPNLLGSSELGGDYSALDMALGSNSPAYVVQALKDKGAVAVKYK